MKARTFNVVPGIGSNQNCLAFYLMGNRKDPGIHTEPSIELLFCGVAGNGVRVCHDVD